MKQTNSMVIQYNDIAYVYSYLKTTVIVTY